jgi:hypothetical protein
VNVGWNTPFGMGHRTMVAPDRSLGLFETMEVDTWEGGA